MKIIFTIENFIGFGIAWKNKRVALILPFVMFELKWKR